MYALALFYKGGRFFFKKKNNVTNSSFIPSDPWSEKIFSFLQGVKSLSSLHKKKFSLLKRDIWRKICSANPRIMCDASSLVYETISGPGCILVLTHPWVYSLEYTDGGWTSYYGLGNYHNISSLFPVFPTKMETTKLSQRTPDHNKNKEHRILMNKRLKCEGVLNRNVSLFITWASWFYIDHADTKWLTIRVHRSL